MNEVDSIGIVIPAFQRVKYIAATLESLLAQDHQNWKCVVVDDGSSDGTAEVADEFAARDSRISVVRQNNSGVSVARNTGYASLRRPFDFVTFMDGDDLWAPGALRVLVAACAKFPGSSGAHGLASTIDLEGRPLPKWNFADFGRGRMKLAGSRLVSMSPEEPTTLDCVLFHSRVYPPGVLLVRSEVQDRAGPFDPAFKYQFEDWDMVVRLCALGPIAFVDSVVAYYRRHTTNATTESGPPGLIRGMQARLYRITIKDRDRRKLVRRVWCAWQKYKIREELPAMRRAVAQRQWSEFTKLVCKLAGRFAQISARGPVLFYSEQLLYRI